MHRRVGAALAPPAIQMKGGKIMVTTMDILDYTYYAEDFGGYAIDEAKFNNLVGKAWAFINYITFGAISEEDMASDDVKNAVCAVAEEFALCTSNCGIVSEQNDGYAVTYTPTSDVHNAMYATAAMYLPSQMMYQGVE